MLRLKFIGQDGSCGFRHGRKYFVRISQYGKHNWYWVDGLFWKRCPYVNLNTLKQNWEMDSTDINKIMRL